MKNISILLLFIFSSGFIRSQTIIPFELVENRIVLKVKVDEKPYRFALDFQKTNLLSQDIVENNNLEILNIGWYPSGTNDSVIANDVMVNQLQIGELKYIKKIFTAVDFSNFKKNNIHIDGFLNVQMFSNYVLELNFVKKQIQLREKGYLPTGNAFNITIYPASDSPYIIASINNKICHLALDFSINAPLTMHNSFFQDELKMNLSNHFSKLGNNLFDNVYAQRTVIKSFKLREIYVHNIEANIIQEKPKYMESSEIVGGIGTQLFLNKILYFDFAKNSLWIK